MDVDFFLNEHFEKNSLENVDFNGSDCQIQLDSSVIIDIINEIKVKNPKNILIFGVGNDTSLWIALSIIYNFKLTFYEPSKEWANIVSQRCAKYTPTIFVHSPPSELVSVKKSLNILDSESHFEFEQYFNLCQPPDGILRNGPYDLILVDSPEGWNESVPGRFHSICWSLRKGILTTPKSVVYVDDADRRLENKTLRKVIEIEKIWNPVIVSHFKSRLGAKKIEFTSKSTEGVIDLITIFNYPNANENVKKMFKKWVSRAFYVKKATPGIRKIKILEQEGGVIEELREYAKDKEVEIETCLVEKYGKAGADRNSHNSGFKLSALCQQKFPYVYLDIDAIPVVDDLSVLVKHAFDKPFIGIDHQTIPVHTTYLNYKFINTGVMVVSSPSFLDEERIRKEGKNIRYYCPGNDQQLIFNYLKVIGYDYTHEQIHYGWNACAGYKKRNLEDGKLYSDGIKEFHEIFVLHYWDEFKPWLRKCEEYENIIEF